MAEPLEIIRPDSFDPDGPQQFATEEEAAKFALEQTTARAHAGEPAAQYKYGFMYRLIGAALIGKISSKVEK